MHISGISICSHARGEATGFRTSAISHTRSGLNPNADILVKSTSACSFWNTKIFSSPRLLRQKMHLTLLLSLKGKIHCSSLKSTNITFVCQKSFAKRWNFIHVPNPMCYFWFWLKKNHQRRVGQSVSWSSSLTLTQLTRVDQNLCSSA